MKRWTLVLAIIAVAWGCRTAPHAEPIRRGRDLPAEANTVVRMARLAHAPQLAGRPGVEIELRSARPFIIGGALAELHVGKETFTLSRYPDDGDTHRLIFILEPSEFDRLENGAPVSVRLGRPPVDARTWVFPPFDRSGLH